MSGVGVSFGADRIYDVMEHLNIFPESLLASSQVMFANFGEKEAVYCLPILHKLRSLGVSAELYPDSVKMKKQFNYAHKKNIQFVAIVGESEMQKGEISIKNMSTGEQETINKQDIQNFLQRELS
jgi:histidyl-tRNA synthetase